MRPCHCPEATIITKQLDSIAEMVAVQLLSVATDTTEEKEKDNVEVKKLRRSVELVRGSHSVDDMLSAINTVLYDQLGFRGAGESYYELENSYIDMVRCGYIIHCNSTCTFGFSSYFLVYLCKS